MEVPARIRDELLEPFITAVTLTLHEMAGALVEVRAVSEKQEHRTLGDVSALLALSPPLGGSLVLSFPEPTAAAVARRVLADVGAEPDEALVCDCLGEVVNVVAGQAKTLLLGTPYHFHLSTPVVLNGAGREIPHPEGGRCFVVAFGGDVGDFALQLCVFHQDEMSSTST